MSAFLRSTHLQSSDEPLRNQMSLHTILQMCLILLIILFPVPVPDSHHSTDTELLSIHSVSVQTQPPVLILFSEAYPVHGSFSLSLIRSSFCLSRRSVSARISVPLLIFLSYDQIAADVIRTYMVLLDAFPVLLS